MVTRWNVADREDLGLTAGAFSAESFTITNRAWYLVHQFVSKVGGRSADLMAGRDTYIPTALANHWGKAITDADLSKWWQVGRWNGSAVVAWAICHTSQADQYLDTHELTPLVETPLCDWLREIGMQLATTPSGVSITGKPMKRNPMSINLSKGGKVDLTKTAGGTLTKVRVGLGWDVRRTTGDAYDLDASIIGLDASGNCAGAPVKNAAGDLVGKEWFVYYNHLASPNNVIVHQGDELTGGKTGDDEQILIDLAAVPAEVTELVVAVTIFDAIARGKQNFGLVENAFVRVVNESNGTELTRYDLTEDTEEGVNSLVFGKLYRKGSDWSFRAIGDGFKDELQGLVTAYKID